MAGELGNGASDSQNGLPAEKVDLVKADQGDAFKDVDFAPRFSYFKNVNHKKTNLHWKDLHLRIEDKHILKGISGHVYGGDVCALIGPSGAGKSSLLNVLAGRVIPTVTKTIEGEIFVNDKKASPLKYRRKIAYVMQEDLLYATATARESLEFSAKLRLPTKTANDQDKVKVIVDDLLESLGLTHVKDTLVGSERVRGLSGGEKKRVAIGVELVTNPSLLFLDEPTSGLDSFSAWKVVKIIENLSKATGCAVLCTIHQPSSEIFNSFQNVMMLCRGEVMYNGTVEQLPPVLASFGKPIPPLTNPADYIMLLAQTIEDNSKLPKFNVDEKDMLIEGKVVKSEKSTKTDAQNKILINGKNSNGSEWLDDGLPVNDAKAGIARQTTLLCVREWRNFKRDLPFLLVITGIRVFLNLLFGLVFFRAGDRGESDYSVDSSFGAMIMVLMSWMFGSAQGPLLSFPLERGIMIREYQTGTYSSFPYLFSKLIVEVPLALLGCFVSLICSYFLIGFHGNFFLYICIMWLIAVSISSYALILGSALSDPRKAVEFAPLILVPQLLFTGLFVPLSSIPIWLRWAQYLCVLKYAVNLGVLVEFRDCNDFDPDQAFQCELLKERNDVDIDLVWLYILVILVIFAVCRTLSLVILVYRANYFAN